MSLNSRLESNKEEENEEGAWAGTEGHGGDDYARLAAHEVALYARPLCR